MKNLSHGNHLVTTSRKGSPSTLHKRSKSSQHSNSVLYDEVEVKSKAINVSDMTEVELKANESYRHTDKRFSTAKSIVMSHHYSNYSIRK